METIDILVGVNQISQAFLVHVGGKRRLNEDAVDIVGLVEGEDVLAQRCLIRVRRQCDVS